MTSDTARLQELMHAILHEPTDAFVVGYLSPDGVTQLCVGGDVQKVEHQEMAHKLLYAYMLRNTASEFDVDEAEFVADGLSMLDDDDRMLQEAVDAGLLPEDALSRYQGGDGSTPADLLRDLIADADPDLPGWDSDGSDGSDDDNDESGGTNIPVN